MVASRAERRRTLPGDSLIANPATVVTHAVTLRAKPEEVWPWLVQMGSGRAGWYSYDVLDNDGHPSSEIIEPALQPIAAGDVLPSLPGERASFIVHALERERDLILVVPSEGAQLLVTWEFALEPIEQARTRLIVRGRIGAGWPGKVPKRPTERRPRPIERIYALLAKAPRCLMVPIALSGHYAMQAKQLKGIKRRAESCILPYDGPLPRATPLSSMRVYAIPTGVTKRSAGFGYQGGSLFEPRDFAMAAVLVQHPRGDLLIDTGFGSDIDARVAAMPWWFRAVTRYVHGRSAAEQLTSTGYDLHRLRAVLVTHAHWDHVAGLSEFVGTPVWVTPEERRYIDEGGWTMDFVRSMKGVCWETYPFEGGPYLGFPMSHDVYGDGTIVVVPAPGHTPGSVVVFLAPPSGTRLALVGDLVWQREGILQRRERPWIVRALGDQDPQGVRDGIRKMIALVSRFPELSIIPAHDTRAFAELEPLPARLGDLNCHAPSRTSALG